MGTEALLNFVTERERTGLRNPRPAEGRVDSRRLCQKFLSLECESL